jgi:hypothetical protein
MDDFGCSLSKTHRLAKTLVQIFMSVKNVRDCWMYKFLCLLVFNFTNYLILIHESGLRDDNTQSGFRIIFINYFFVNRFNLSELLVAIDERVLVKIKYLNNEIERYVSLDEKVEKEIARLTNNIGYELQFMDGWILDSEKTFRQNNVQHDRCLQLISLNFT